MEHDHAFADGLCACGMYRCIWKGFRLQVSGSAFIADIGFDYDASPDSFESIEAVQCMEAVKSPAQRCKYHVLLSNALGPSFTGFVREQFINEAAATAAALKAWKLR